jgi:DNA-binding response OmpR family regulator/uncharacterized protein (DUF2267 family)
MGTEKRTWCVLLADNDPDFLATRAEHLSDAGFRVLMANTLAEARRLLAEAHVHLAVIDIRLVDDDDEKDISGLTLAKDPAYRLLPKIILTAFPIFQAVREALKPTPDGPAPAVDFLDKKEGSEAFIQAVNRALDRHVRLSWELQIDWNPQDPSFLHLAKLLQPELCNEIVAQRAYELEDLCRRLFYDCPRIRVGGVLWQSGSRFCLPVLLPLPRAKIGCQILVCGRGDTPEEELLRAADRVPTALGSLSQARTARTDRFQGVAYELADADMESLQTLRLRLQSEKRGPLRAALKHLLDEVLNAWHQEEPEMDPGHDLMTLYRQRTGLEDDGLSREEVEHRVYDLLKMVPSTDQVKIEREAGAIRFHFPADTPLICPDPVAAIYEPLKGYGPPVQCRLSPGRLTADSILIDLTQRAWLTDWAGMGVAPQWWDFVCLEAAIRFDLVQPPDWMAQNALEACLMEPADLEKPLQEQEVMADLQTKVALIEEIRRKAANEAGPDPRPYFAGLLVWAVSAMAQYHPDRLYAQAERRRALHLLQAAARLASRLSEPASPPTEEPMLSAGENSRDSVPVPYLDQDGVLWIAQDRPIYLPPQQLALFRCLWDQAREVVSRQKLVEEGLSEAFDQLDSYQPGRLNMGIQRLRKTLKRCTGRADLIKTVRGRGYRLDMGGEQAS